MTENELKIDYSKYPNNRLFTIVCTPVSGDTGTFGYSLEVLVVAETSSEATRKVVSFFRNIYPESNVKSIEVESFICQVKDKVIVV